MFTKNLKRTVLDNGLTVIVKPTFHAPVASFWMWYRVGSRIETPGKTGASHWVEHMVFKGTDAFPAGEADRLVARVGGVRNAMTWVDFTTYFETVPAEHIDLVLQLEADRVLNSRFDANEVEAERNVIISERQGYENDPQFLLDEDVRAIAFRSHGYRYETIGWQCDLEAMTRDDLHAHFRQFYAPQNAVAVAVGPFDPAEMTERIAHYFGSLPTGQAMPTERVIEPPQTGERRIERVGPGDTAYVQVAFHAPPALDDDFLALSVLDSILGGAHGMGLFNESEPNRSSRLYQALVETELAAEISTQLLPTVAPYLYSISATVQSPTEPKIVEAAILAEIERIATEPVSAAELAKTIKQNRAAFIYGSESVTDQAYWLGFSEVVASLDWLDNLLERTAAVTPEDIQRVAATYLDATNRTVGTYLPVFD